MVEGTTLERWRTRKCTGGSNPPLSAIKKVFFLQQGKIRKEVLKKG